MKRTHWLTLFALWAVGAVLAWAVQWALTVRGLPTLVIPVTFSVVVILMGGVLLALAWPIRQTLRSTTAKPPVDPLYAVRVVLLAKASSLTGSLVGGAAVGAAVFALSRPVITVDALLLSGAGFIGALVLMVSGLLSEKWCTLPPEAGSESGQSLPEGETA